MHTHTIYVLYIYMYIYIYTYVYAHGDILLNEVDTVAKREFLLSKWGQTLEFAFYQPLFIKLTVR